MLQRHANKSSSTRTWSPISILENLGPRKVRIHPPIHAFIFYPSLFAYIWILLTLFQKTPCHGLVKTQIYAKLGNRVKRSFHPCITYAKISIKIKIKIYFLGILEVREKKYFKTFSVKGWRLLHCPLCGFKPTKPWLKIRTQNFPNYFFLFFRTHFPSWATTTWTRRTI